MAKRILVIDDENDVLQMVAFILTKHGYEALPADNGPDGLRLAYEHIPQVAILDLWLPVMDGVAISRHLRQDTRTKAMPIILLTASADMISEKVKECQANDFLLKPFDYRELLQKIERLLLL
jgi:DNA-binding response OmpR family regulator